MNRLEQAPHRVFVIGEGCVYPYLQESGVITKPSDLSEVIYAQGTLAGILPPERRYKKYPHEGAIIGNFLPPQYADEKLFLESYRAHIPRIGFMPHLKKIRTIPEAIAVTATLLALEDAGITADCFDEPTPWLPKGETHGKPLRVAVGVTNSIGIIEKIAQGARDGFTRHNALEILRSTMPGYVNGAIVDTLHSQGPSIHHSCACATAGFQIDTALAKLQYGNAELAFVGGYEVAPQDLMYGFGLVGALPDVDTYKDDPGSAVRPLDRSAKTFGFSEGAFVLALITEEAALRLHLPPGKIKGEVITSATGQDYARLSPPDDSASYERIIRESLEAAGLLPEQVGLIINHSPGTIKSDEYALSAVRRVYELPARTVDDLYEGEQAGLPCLTAPKAVTWHTFAPSFAVTSHTIFDVLRTGIVPGTKNLQNPHGLAFNVSGQNIPHEVEYALAGAESMDGSHAVAIFRRAPEEFPIYDRGNTFYILP